jgi:hypothetical protein
MANLYMHYPLHLSCIFEFEELSCMIVANVVDQNESKQVSGITGDAK